MIILKRDYRMLYNLWSFWYISRVSLRVGRESEGLLLQRDFNLSVWMYFHLVVHDIYRLVDLEILIERYRLKLLWHRLVHVEKVFVSLWKSLR